MIALIERLLEFILTPIFKGLVRGAMKDARAEGPGGAMRRMHETYRQGQYQNVLALLNTAMRCGADLSVFRANVLMQLGHMEEAEQVLSKAITTETQPKPAALANCVYGEFLIFQQRYNKALDCFQNALVIWPERGSAQRGIAEVWLRRQENSDEALRRAQIAVEKDRSDAGITPETKAANLGTSLAVLAWATAVTSGDADAVTKLVAEALVVSAGISVTCIAQIHVYAALAFTVLGDDGKRAQHYDAAGSIDPHGIWGREGLKAVALAR